MVPYEAFLSEKPVVTTTDAGGPLEIVTTARPGSSSRRTPPRSRGALRWLARAPRRGAGVGQRRQGARRARHLGQLHRRAALVKVAYYCPMPPSGRGSPTTARCSCRRCASGSTSRSSRGRTRPSRGTDVALYHVGNNPDAHGWIVDALRKRPGRRRPARVRAPPPRRRADDRPRATAAATSTRWSARAASSAGCSATACSTSGSRRSGRAGPSDFPLAGEVLDLATGLIVHSRYVEERARAAGTTGRVWRDPASGLAEHAPIEPAAARGRARCSAAFGNVNASKRIPQLLEAFARLRRDRPARGCCSSARPRRGFDLDRRLQRLGLVRRGHRPGGLRDEERLWALMAACDVLVDLRSPTMGETSGSVDPRALARQACSSSATSAGSPSCPTTSR